MKDENGSCGCNVQKLEARGAEAPGTVEEVVLRVWGMGCDNCANRVHNGLVSADGVLAAQVDLTSATAWVSIDPWRIRPEDLLALVDAAAAGSRHRYHAAILVAP